VNPARKIKILRLIARLNIGGPAIHTVLLTSDLNKDRFDTVLACGCLSPGEGDMSYYAREKKVCFRTIPALARELSFFQDLRALKQVYSLIVRERPDILHTHTAKAGTLGRVAGVIYNFVPWHKKVKIVHTFHGHVLNSYFGRVRSFVFICIERILAGVTDQIITVSASVKDDLVGLGIAAGGRIRVVPLGFDLEKFLALPCKAAGARPVVGIVGRIVPVKNHRLFIDAAAAVGGKEGNAGIGFTVVGDGPGRQSLEDYVKTLEIPRVEFTGWKKDLDAVYAQLDLVVLTSLNEGTPVSLIEAMASAKAVVATDVGGVRDLLGKACIPPEGTAGLFSLYEHGILVRPNDRDGLARAITFMLADSGMRRTMGMAGREYVKKAYAKTRLIKDIEDLYENLVRP
jgi:glycosyltransferase involved in cell wall biosynthesis